MKNDLKPIPRLIVALLLGILGFLIVATLGVLVELVGMWLFGWSGGGAFACFLAFAAFAGTFIFSCARGNLPRY